MKEVQVRLHSFFTSAIKGVGRHFTLWPLYPQRKSLSMPLEEQAAYDWVFKQR
jgi:hypothetical protein